MGIGGTEKDKKSKGKDTKVETVKRELDVLNSNKSTDNNYN